MIYAAVNGVVHVSSRTYLVDANVGFDSRHTTVLDRDLDFKTIALALQRPNNIEVNKNAMPFEYRPLQ